MNTHLKLQLDIEPIKLAIRQTLCDRDNEIEAQIEGALKQLDVPQLIAELVKKEVPALVKAATERTLSAMILDALRTPDIWLSVNQAVGKHVEKLLESATERWEVKE